MRILSCYLYHLLKRTLNVTFILFLSLFIHFCLFTFETSGQGAMPVTFVLFAMENMGMDSATLGALLAANVLMMVGISRPATVLSDSVKSRKSIMVPTLAASAVLTGLQPFAPSALPFALLVAASSAGSAISLPSFSPVLLDHTTEAERSRALAMRQTTQDVGTLLGASTMGVVATHVGIPEALFTVAVLQGAAAAFFAVRTPALPVDLHQKEK
jgi:sugar phosphate permease